MGPLSQWQCTVLCGVVCATACAGWVADKPEISRPHHAAYLHPLNGNSSSPSVIPLPVSSQPVHLHPLHA